MKHILLIPDGMRRYARWNNIELNESNRRGGRMIAELAYLIQNVYQLAEEVSVFVFAAYNMTRTQQEVNAIGILNSSFLNTISSVYETLDIEIKFLGKEEIIYQQFTDSYKTLQSILQSKSNKYSKQLNLLLGYDSLNSCPDEVPAHQWKPFKHPIDLIYRFGQPESLVRGSAIFPMSDQAFWYGDSQIFLNTNNEETCNNISILKSRIVNYKEILYVE